MSLAVVNPCTVLQLSVLVMAASSGGGVWFLAVVSPVFIAGHLYIPLSPPGSTLHFHELGTHLPAKPLIAGKSCKLAAIGSFSERNRFESCLSRFFPSSQKEQGRTAHAHSVDLCYVLALSVWVFGSTDGQDPCCLWQLQGAQGQCTTEPIPQGRESKCPSPLNRLLSLPALSPWLRWVLTCLFLTANFC